MKIPIDILSFPFRQLPEDFSTGSSYGKGVVNIFAKS
jgi:hypothetical protein